MPGLTSAPLQLAGAARFVIAANPPPHTHTREGTGEGGRGEGQRSPWYYESGFPCGALGWTEMDFLEKQTEVKVQW